MTPGGSASTRLTCLYVKVPDGKTVLKMQKHCSLQKKRRSPTLRIVFVKSYTSTFWSGEEEIP